MTFLGMTLDRKLTFCHHFNKLIAKCESKINLLRVAKGTQFGCSKNSMIILYKALIQSQLDYGAQVYASVSKTQLARLDHVQGKALRIVLGALPGTSQQSLLREAGVKPLHLRREELTLKYAMRVKARGRKCIEGVVAMRRGEVHVH